MFLSCCPFQHTGDMLHLSCMLQAATEYGANWAKAWHHWALFNCSVLEALHNRGDTAAAQYVAPAVTGFFRRCVLAQPVQQRFTQRSISDTYFVGASSSTSLTHMLLMHA
jgi:hypothetical protein